LGADPFVVAPSLAGQAGSRPGGRGTFFCFAKRKYPKKRRAGCAVPPLRCGHAALLGPGGDWLNSPSAQTTPALIRLAVRYSPSHDGSIRNPPALRLRRVTPRGNAGGLAKSDPRRSWLKAFAPEAMSPIPHPNRCRVAGLSSAAAGGSGRALSERSEFSPTPPDASSARHREAARTSARFFFAYFLLAKQKKVSRPPGRDPARLANTKATSKRISK
jgi:hypothetical protein